MRRAFRRDSSASGSEVFISRILFFLAASRAIKVDSLTVLCSGRRITNSSLYVLLPSVPVCVCVCVCARLTAVSKELQSSSPTPTCTPILHSESKFAPNTNISVIEVRDQKRKVLETRKRMFHSLWICLLPVQNVF
jgi:hypothetical protein